MYTKRKLSNFAGTLFLMMVFISCSSGSNEKVEAQTVQGNHSPEVTTPGEAIVETVENGNRLTESALKSQVPDMLLGIEKSGDANYKEARSGSGSYVTVYQMYYDTDNLSAHYLDIFDYGDDQNHINDIQDGLRYTNTDFSETRQNENGWYITETFDARGEDVTSRTLTVRNPRFMIELRSAQGNDGEVPSFEEMMASLEEAKLLALLELEIPQGSGEIAQSVDNRNDLDCDAILPVEQVSSFCEIDGITANVTSFEQEKNCNRQYAHPDNFGGLTFIVTQYSNGGTAESAVEAKLNDSDLSPVEVGDLGDAASMVSVDGNLFLSVAHNNYLVELRSGEGMGPTETCCVCLDQDKLITLANNILGQLP